MEPLKPSSPALAHETALPCVSEIVTIVLLVRLGTLTSYGQSLSVTYTAVTSDIDESLDIISDVTAKVTFYTAVVLDVLSEL